MPTAAVATLRAVPAASRIAVIGHRGASGYRPEHTLAAYKLAIDLGADFIEPDVVSTKDGVLVARHECELGRTTDVASRPRFASRRTTKEIDGTAVTGWFAEDFTLAELKRLRARERFPELRPANTAFDGLFEIPTLGEVLDLAGIYGAGVCPETKHPAHHAAAGLPLEEPLVRTLHAHGYRSGSAPAFVQSFDADHLRRLAGMTGVPLVQLLRDGPVTRTRLDRIAGYADGVGLHRRLILGPRAGGLVGRAHAAGLAVYAWTFRLEDGRLEDGLGRAFALGVDGVVCDQPELAVALRGASARARSRGRVDRAAAGAILGA